MSIELVCKLALCFEDRKGDKDNLVIDQMYSGDVDYQTIKKVKQSVSIPVIGNGNVFDKQS